MQSILNGDEDGDTRCICGPNNDEGGLQFICQSRNHKQDDMLEFLRDYDPWKFDPIVPTIEATDPFGPYLLPFPTEYHKAHGPNLCWESDQAPYSSGIDLTAAIETVEREAVASGGFASVYIGRCKGSQVAVKVIRVIRDKVPTAQRRLRREIRVWKPLDHQNITPFLGVAHFPELSQLEAMITPWYRNGSATEYLNKTSLPYLGRLRLAIGVARGLEYLHDLEPAIVHGDLKPSNILIDDHGQPRICDFGLARIISQEVGTGLTTTTRHNSTPLYAAPEILMAPDDAPAFEPSTESDIYSLGSLIYEFLTRTMPYPTLRGHMQVLVAVIKGEKPAKRPSQINSHYVYLMWELFEDCWGLEPKGRPEVEFVLHTLAIILREYEKEVIKPSPTPTAGLGLWGYIYKQALNTSRQPPDLRPPALPRNGLEKREFPDRRRRSYRPY